MADAGRPVRLQDQAQRAGWHRGHQFVEQGLRRHAALGRGAALAVAELFLEPAHHPVAAKDLHFAVVVAGQRGRVRRHERQRLGILARADVDGGRGAVRDAADVRFQAARTEYFAGLVGRGGDHGHAGRDTRGRTGRGAHASEHRAHRQQIGQLLATDRQALPFPVGRLGPRVGLEVERHVAHLRADRVDELAGQLPVQQPRQQQHLVRARPGRGLVFGPPVDLGFALEVAHRVAHPRETERRAPGRADRRHLRGAALVQPDQRRQRGGAVGGDGHDRAALRGHRDAAHRGRQFGTLQPQLAAGARASGPEAFDVVGHPARLLDDVVVQRHLRLRDEVAARIEQQRTRALRAAVDSEQQVVGAGSRHGVGTV